MKRIVITSMGMLSSIGESTDEHLSSLKTLKSGYKPISRFDTSHAFYRNSNACVIDINRLSNICHNDPTLQINTAIYSIKEVIHSTSISKQELANTALIIGSSIGASQSFSKFYKSYHQEQKITQEKELELASHSTQTIATEIAKQLSIGGSLCTISTACSASTNAVGRAMDMIRSGRTNTVIAGGVDIFTEFAFSGFNCLQAISPEMCQPFSKQRSGVTLGDASCFFLIEDYDYAKKMGRPILAELMSYHFFNEAYHPTSLKPDGSSVYFSMKKTLDKAKVSADQVDYISAHGTATKVNDPTELKGIEQLVQNSAVRDQPLYVSSTKSQIGHCLGAAGAMEIGAIVLGMNHQFVPANIGSVKSNLIPSQAKIEIPITPISKKINYALSNSFAFGGNMSSILLKSYN